MFYVTDRERRGISSRKRIELCLRPKETFSFALPWWSGDCSDSLPTALILSSQLPPLLTAPFNLAVSLFISFLFLPCPQGNNRTSKPLGFRLQTKNCSNNRPEEKENQVSKLNRPCPQWKFWRCILLETQCDLMQHFLPCFIYTFTCACMRAHTYGRGIIKTKMFY